MNIYDLNVNHYGNCDSIIDYFSDTTGSAYYISKYGDNFIVLETTLDEDGNEIDGLEFVRPSLSAAIAAIEALERGEGI